MQESPGLFDIEVVDDWIFVYAPGEIVTSDPNTWSWAASVTDALLGAAQRWQGSTRRAETSVAAPLAAAREPVQRLSSSRLSGRRIVLTLALLALCTVAAILLG